MKRSKKIFSSFALIGEELELLNDVIIEIQEDNIIKISNNNNEIEMNCIEPEFKFENCIIIPGFINSHTHIGDSFAKELGYKLKINEIVQSPKGLKHYLLDTVKKETIIDGIKNSILEMIYTGTTTFVDFRENGITGIKLIDEAEKSLIKEHRDLKIGRIILGRPNKDLKNLDELLKICDGVGLSTTNNYSDEELTEIKEKCEKYNKIISVHVAETKEERMIADKEFNSSDVYRAILLLNANPVVHAIHINQKDLRLLRAKERGIVICPRANSYFGVGFPAIQEFIKQKISICIGTDNVMANSLNLFREFEFIIKYLRSVFGPKVIDPLEVLKMVSVYPSKIYNLKDRGWLSPEKRADFSIIDLSGPHLRPLNKILETLTLRVNSKDIKSIFLGGNRIDI